jgi:Reverse transcriptase (RNA-dependent DNA polymerase)
MNLSPGYKLESGKDLVCKLQKMIYRLKQSPKVWYAKLSSYLLSLKFNICNADHSLFLKHDKKLTTLILV